MNTLTQQGVITIANDGPLISETNYWATQYSHSGYAYLTWNSGTARLLVPENLKPALRDMSTAKHVIISRGPHVISGGRDAIEILFEDFSDAPYSLMLGIEQTDRMPSERIIKDFPLTIWTREGLKQSHRGKFRQVNRLPCLSSW
ncbi:hypothetical protein N1078_18440 [Pseudomonas sp. MIL19]|uniref:hypothetical protein n=1 Tax=Pseudomonas sp. MIL19 TaxID=2976979 RepID=UPI002364979B|nr:hypothetical protein [Pseudomonas sp. MIL19]MDD2162542.1 hypothetical protein [Pseudomonas sp. MIL19]